MNKLNHWWVRENAFSVDAVWRILGFQLMGSHATTQSLLEAEASCTQEDCSFGRNSKRKENIFVSVEELYMSFQLYKFGEKIPK